MSGLAWAWLCSASVNAQDIEIFAGHNEAFDPAKPNILFILDDSGSMGAQVLTQNSFDPTDSYPGLCDQSRVYWSATESVPVCDSTAFIELANFHCQTAIDALNTAQGGTYRDFFAQYDPDDQDRWEALSAAWPSRIVECQDDLPDPAAGWAGHGGPASATAVFPQNGNDTRPWTSDPEASSRVSWGTFPTAQQYTVYSGNYLNWYFGAATVATRLKVMQDVAINTISSISDVNVGLMHFDSEEGGVVSHAVGDVTTSRASMATAINSLVPGGFTPLEESLYEAYLYMRGASAVYGGAGVSSAFSDPGKLIYDSPIEQSCQKNHIVLLTDGEPRRDESASSAISGLVDADGNSFSDLGGATCDIETYPPGVHAEGGHCLDDLAEFMFRGDLSPLPGRQNVTTHTVGFLVDLPILEQTAARGGGEYHTANDTASLSAALTNIVTSILETQSTFTAPSVSINAFNQTRNLNDIYIGVFQPSGTAHWPGNLKKFRLRASDSTIVDANDQPVIDKSTGLFRDSVQDFWSADVDGGVVDRGGAANMIPANRKVYTWLGSDSELTHASNAIASTNPLLTDALLNTGGAGAPTRHEILEFINGIDASDADQDGITGEPRLQLGDPLHSRPVVVVYGPNNDDALVFMGTNDGYLHAINVDDGSEAWAFLPPEFLPDQVDLFTDNSSSSKIYGVDGSIRIQTIADNDGLIEAADGERVLLFFGMRRGGDAYYALDITDPDRPEVLWRMDSSDLPGIGQSWSSVAPTRIDIAGKTQNIHKLALVIGGGYDASQDAIATSTDSIGNSIYIVDTLSGELLWHGTSNGGDQNFSNADRSMAYSIPADIRVLDMNSDGFADRMYAADMGGQIWRFDILNGNKAADLVEGGVIAQLGAAGPGTPTDADTRRFYYAPDVARVVTEDYNFLHIGIGSGHRAHPNSTANQDEFYALRDYRTFTARTQAEYDELVPVTPGDLVDVTTDLAASVPQGSPGWRMSLNDGGWIGEKVLAEARTFAGQVFISTYRPGGGVGCGPAPGITRQYVVNLFNARPVANLDGSVDDYNDDGVVDPSDLTLTDRYREFTGPPPPETAFFFPAPEGDADGDGDIDADDEQFTLACMASGNCLSEIPCSGLRCFDNGEERYPVRTFWVEEFFD